MATDSTNKSTILTSLNEYRLLGRSGLRVSPLCLGTMTFGEDWAFGSNHQESKKIFDLYRSQGGNFFDTANVYTNGSSEKFLGEYISGIRSEAVVATKYSANLQFGFKMSGKLPQGTFINPNGGGNSRKSMVENLDASLQRLGIGYVDVYYVHNWEFKTPFEEVMRGLDDVVRSGKALYVAISDAPAWVIGRANLLAEMRGWSPFIGLQTRYNLIERSMEVELAPMADEVGLGIVPWGILAEGFLTGKHKKEETTPDASLGRKDTISRHSADERNWKVLEEVLKVAKEVGKTPAQVVTNWTLQRPITSALVGVKSLQQLEDNLGALTFKLSPEHMAKLNALSAPDKPFPQSMLSRITMFNDCGLAVKETRRNAWFD